jgi:hypothetical protein
MNRRVVFALAAFVMAFQLSGALAYAQSAQKISAEIGFPFVAGGKEMPAGKYSVVFELGKPLEFYGQNGTRVLLAVITSLGRHDQDPDAEFVFDKVDGKSVLSEIWMPKRDGFLVLATAKPHEHVVLGGSNPKK